MSLAAAFRQRLYAFILWLAHSIFNLVIGLYNWTTRWRKAWFRKSASNCGDLADRVQRLSKIPNHLAFVMSFHELKCTNLLLTQIAHLVKWSLLIGIENITVYDDLGEF